MNAIEIEGLTKSFGDLVAVNNITLSVEVGTVYGLLGPNGAGKTTTVRILTTLLKPDSGSARVAGFDVTTQPQQLRTAIGLAGQYAAVDEILTGKENLEMVGRLYGFDKAFASQRAEEIIDQFDLADAANRQVKTYSGGMRKRLDLGASLVGMPRVLFLDEPTTGLDLRSRRALWEMIEQLVDGGTTLLLTTQYLEEADYLADRIGVIDGGKLIAEGTPEELKKRVGGDVLEIQVADLARIDDAIAAVAEVGIEPPRRKEEGRVVIPVSSEVGVITDTVRRLDRADIKLRDLAIRRPTMDDVFMTLTGHGAEEDVDGATATPTPHDRRRAR